MYRNDAASLSLEEKLTVFGSCMLSVLTTDSQAMQLYRVVVDEAGHSDIGELFRESGVRESMAALTLLMQTSMAQGTLAPNSPELLAKQFTSLVKAEVDELLLKREVEILSEACIQEMVPAAVTLFIKGAC